MDITKKLNVTKDDIPISTLREMFFIDDQWCLRNKVTRSNNAKVGNKSGNKRPDGYIKISIGGKNYRAHRIIWALHYNKWPQKQIDHINGIRDDNRIENLREADYSENSMNGSNWSNNKSGIKGVRWREDMNRYVGFVGMNRKQKHVGTFTNIEDAIEAVRKVREEMHGEFANFG